ncbi:hypothetical protein [Thiomonas bhubaneswarensis]|uniref:Uncharacterized protein n=1 Tax=Thiomonas bhubaneswarensis TaxID=339866 RepID=A0A0K6I5P1_9BURK|nr:hypothetical protein [Thiomonas bhubaneswarensis]CUA98455.1 hypothetical protein Ga0061069_107109 [Thiomonas bhubaneswarensis]
MAEQDHITTETEKRLFSIRNLALGANALIRAHHDYDQSDDLVAAVELLARIAGEACHA